MPFAEIVLVPSVNVEPTPAGNPAGVQQSNFIRWRDKLPEKKGGCSLFIDSPVNGAPMSLKPWGDFEGNEYLGIATPYEVYSYNATTQINKDITPQFINKDFIHPTFTTVAGESLVTITDTTTTGLTTFDSVAFNTPVAVGGLILNGTYPIVSVFGTNRYVIDVGYAAQSSVSNIGGTLPVFHTDSGLSRVIVTFPIKYQYTSLAVGNRFGLLPPTSVGGITLQGQYIVGNIIQDGYFSFESNQIAAFTDTQTMNSGAVSLTYWITKGPGAGNILVGNIYQNNNWWLDSIGSTMIACATNGPIFSYSPIGGYSNLSVLTNAPRANNGAFVSMPSGQIMAWGTCDNLDLIQNPLYIRWSDAADFNNWTIGGQSQAGFYTIPTGSKIVRGIQGPNQQYWFTDIDVYTAQYTSYPDFFSFLKIGAGCGLIAPRGIGIINNSIYWMSQKQFFVAQGGSAPTPLACSVWDFIFQNSNTTNLEHTICATNSVFNEISWYFASTNSINGVPDAYVCYNTLYNEWDYGYLERTAWTDQSVLGYPIGSDSSGWIYQHETTYNLAVGNTTRPINSSLTTGYTSLTNGNDLIFVDWVLPDMKWGEYDQNKSAILSYTFYVTDYAGQTPRTYGPYNVSKDTPYVCPRFRGRFLSMKIESNDYDSFWRLGSIRYRFAPSGRR